MNYTMMQLLREASAAVKGHGSYSSHQLAIHANGNVSLVVFYKPKDAEHEIKTYHGFPSATKPGLFETSVAI